MRPEGQDATSTMTRHPPWLAQSTAAKQQSRRKQQAWLGLEPRWQLVRWMQRGLAELLIFSIILVFPDNDHIYLCHLNTKVCCGASLMIKRPLHISHFSLWSNVPVFLGTRFCQLLLLLCQDLQDKDVFCGLLIFLTSLSGSLSQLCALLLKTPLYRKCQNLIPLKKQFAVEFKQNVNILFKVLIDSQKIMLRTPFKEHICWRNWGVTMAMWLEGLWCTKHSAKRFIHSHQSTKSSWLSFKMVQLFD